MEREILHKENSSNGMFYIENDQGIISELTYVKKENNIMVIDHSETKKEFEGKGLASKVLDHAVNYARDKGYKIDPLCPFAEVKFDENEAYQDVKV